MPYYDTPNTAAGRAQNARIREKMVLEQMRQAAKRPAQYRTLQDHDPTARKRGAHEPGIASEVTGLRQKLEKAAKFFGS